MCYTQKKEKLFILLLKHLLVNLNYVFLFSLFFQLLLFWLLVLYMGHGEGYTTVLYGRGKYPLAYAIF
jgi:hypothetical protein